MSSRRRVIMLAIMMVVWLERGERLSFAALPLPLSAQVSEQLWDRLAIPGKPAALQVAGVSVRSGHLVLQFYTRRLFWPAWSNDAGLLPQGSGALLDSAPDAALPADW